MRFNHRIFLAAAFAATCVLQLAYTAEGFDLRVLSSRPNAVSGDSALVQLDAPRHFNWSVYQNDRDITSSFRRSQRTGTMLALLDGLRIGENKLIVRTGRRVRSRVRVTNHPLAGPIFSGPHQQPFVCQTEENGLGPALNADCAATTMVQYYYKSTGRTQMSALDTLIAEFDAHFRPTVLPPGFKLYDPAGPRPSDIAQILLPDGRTVNYIVRRERGVINRAVYDIQFLNEPGEPLPTPWTGPTGDWNGRIVYAFGGGCGAGYRQGLLPVYERAEYEQVLAQGYALLTSSLNVLGNTCNDKISAETASMVKEYFIKQFGEPDYTIGTGGSGGAVSVYLIAQNYPGILDGIIAYLSAPDIITTVIPVFSDCALLEHALRESKLSWTDVQKSAISGFATWQTCAAAAAVLVSLGWLDPKRCDSSLPKETIYDRISNIGGTRCTFYDNAINVFGRDPQTGFARRTLDNVGIQYGHIAFDAGSIDAERFIELNERLGGYNLDGEIIPARTVADPEAIRAAYEHGELVAGTSLGNVPIVDWNRYADDYADIHTIDRAFITRNRLIEANGSADNQVILVTPRPIFEGPSTLDVRALPGVGLRALVPAMDRWLASIQADQSDIPLFAKIVHNKPAELMDGCIAIDGERVSEPAIYGGSGRCNRMYPLHGNPRVAAGAPISGEPLKCALKPFNASDYVRPLTPDQLKRLHAVFSTGVCDYSKPGVDREAEPIIWHAYGNETE